jgi:hypothetical protein
MKNLKFADKLLADIVYQLNTEDYNMCRLYSISVQFLKDDQPLKKGNLNWALDCISNDLYWDDESNWEDANKAELFLD